jgi:hypothetical protein
MQATEEVVINVFDEIVVDDEVPSSAASGGLGRSPTRRRPVLPPEILRRVQPAAAGAPSDIDTGCEACRSPRQWPLGLHTPRPKHHANHVSRKPWLSNPGMVDWGPTPASAVASVKLADWLVLWAERGSWLQGAGVLGFRVLGVLWADQCSWLRGAGVFGIRILRV